MKIALIACNAELVCEICASAQVAIGFLRSHIAEVDVICLDHDLESTPENESPGDGRDVVQWLVSQFIKKPVLIHTSNGPCGREMERTLKENGWRCESLVPFNGNDWIRISWGNWLERMASKPSDAA